MFLSTALPPRRVGISHLSRERDQPETVLMVRTRRLCQEKMLPSCRLICRTERKGPAAEGAGGAPALGKGAGLISANKSQKRVLSGKRDREYPRAPARANSNP